MVEVSLQVEVCASYEALLFARAWLANDAEGYIVFASIGELQTAIN